jgi:hypothetical protein
MQGHVERQAAPYRPVSRAAHNAGLRQGAGGEWEIHGDPTEAAFLARIANTGRSYERRLTTITSVPSRLRLRLSRA